MKKLKIELTYIESSTVELQLFNLGSTPINLTKKRKYIYNESLQVQTGIWIWPVPIGIKPYLNNVSQLKALKSL